MVWSLFSKKIISAAPSTVEAIKLLNELPTEANRQSLYRTFDSGLLLLAARGIPREWGHGPITLERAVTVSALTSSAPDGGEALLAFTNAEEAARRNPALSTFAMEALDVVRLAVADNFSALVINPAGPWAAVPLSDMQAILAVSGGGR